MTPTNEAGHGLPEVAAAREVIRAYFAGELDDTMILNLSESLALSRGVPELARRAIPFLRDEAANYADDGNNEPLELARAIEAALAENPNRDAANPGGCECEKCGRIFIGAEWHVLCGICIDHGVAQPDGSGLRNGENVPASTPEASPQPQVANPAYTACNVEGTWLWGKLMDWCRSQGTSPANFDSLFAIASEAHKLYAAPAAAGAQGEEYAACCDTPAYCASVRRCTRMDTTPQPAAADGGVRERARELLAVELEHDGFAETAYAVRSGWSVPQQAPALRVIEALSSHRQAGDDLSKFRKLAETFLTYANRELAYARNPPKLGGGEASSESYSACAAAYTHCGTAVLALVEKGAGNG